MTVLTKQDQDRLVAFTKRMEWFADNQYDISPRRAGPYMLAIQFLLVKWQESADPASNDETLTALENILREAEGLCLPEDAHSFRYDPYWKMPI